MSRSHVLSFLLLSVTLYSFNKPESGHASFVASSEAKKDKVQFVPNLKKRPYLRASESKAGQEERSVLFSGTSQASHKGHIEQVLKAHKNKFVKIHLVTRKFKDKKTYAESALYERDDLVIAIKTELFRLGCYRGKINTVWDREVKGRLDDLNRALVTRRAERSTLSFLKKQTTLGCAGNRVWDQLVYANGTNSWHTKTKVVADTTPFREDKDIKLASKKVADLKLLQSVKKSKRLKRKRTRRRRRVAQKSFSFNDLFQISAF